MNMKICTHCNICIRYGDKCTKYSHVCMRKSARNFVEKEGLKDIMPAEWKAGKTS